MCLFQIIIVIIFIYISTLFYISSSYPAIILLFTDCTKKDFEYNILNAIKDYFCRRFQSRVSPTLRDAKNFELKDICSNSIINKL